MRRIRSHILALDQGTTSSRAIVFDKLGRPVAVAQSEFPQIYPRPGWVEHDPATIWKTQLNTAKRALRLAKLSAGDIAAIGITNQRETTLLWDRDTGKRAAMGKVASEAADLVVVTDDNPRGEDPGAIGPSGTREKDVALDIARRLAAEVNRTQGFKAVLIRDGDYYLGLRQRTQLAREQKADFFVSVHADAFTSPRPQGSSVYALSQRGATSETAQWLADSENRSDLIGGVDGSLSLRDKDQVLRGVLLDLTMTATLNDSLSIGGQVLEQLGRVNRLHKSRVEQAGFMVLKSPDIPSLLIEVGFISNPDEERRLRDPVHQQGLATAIFSGLRDHFQRNPPPASLLAWQRDNQRSPTGNEYRIQSGDTLSAIAIRHGVPVNQLKQANDLNGDVIRVGQVLRIPSS